MREERRREESTRRKVGMLVRTEGKQAHFQSCRVAYIFLWNLPTHLSFSYFNWVKDAFFMHEKKVEYWPYSIRNTHKRWHVSDQQVSFFAASFYCPCMYIHNIIHNIVHYIQHNILHDIIHIAAQPVLRIKSLLISSFTLWLPQLYLDIIVHYCSKKLTILEIVMCSWSWLDKWEYHSCMNAVN